MIYKCQNCGQTFQEPEEVQTTYESYYGVMDLFPNYHLMTYYCCPYCHEEDFEEMEETDE